MRTKATDMFGLDTPIFAFSHCRDVVVEATKAGGMGVLGTTRLDPEQLEQELRWIDGHTHGRPYGLDLALPNKMEKARPMAERATALPEEHIRFVDRLLEKANIPPLPAHERAALYKETPGFRLTAEGGMELIDVALRHPQIKLVVSALGVAPRDMIDRLHANGIKVGALVGSVEHARRQDAAGMDILVAQGMEAGAHTGNIASMVLWPQVVDAVAPLPVLAAGGVGRGRQIAAALALGAEGVWCGSIWLGTRESELSPEMKQRFFAAGSEDAVQRRRVHVEHRPVRVVADDLGGAGRQRPVDRRVHLAEQQPPALLVGLAGRNALGPVDDPGHALHVEGDEDLHPERAWRVPWRPSAPPSGA